jgi:hypothetical protein
MLAKTMLHLAIAVGKSCVAAYVGYRVCEYFEIRWLLAHHPHGDGQTLIGVWLISLFMGAFAAVLTFAATLGFLRRNRAASNR